MDTIKKWFKSLRSRKDHMGVPPQYLYRSGWDLGSGSGFNVNDYISISSVTSPSTGPAPKVDERIEKKPVEVWKEIVSENKPSFDTTNLDAHIKLVKRRMDMLTELGINISDETEALRFLEARKKFLKKGTDFRWPITTLGMIEDLTKKYKLAYTDFNLYSKTIPMEAIDELEAFMKQYSMYRDDKPVLKLIIDDIPTKEHGGRSWERKKDPILLASSPFGKWFHILGAWDKEVQVVDALVYHGK